MVTSQTVETVGIVRAATDAAVCLRLFSDSDPPTLGGIALGGGALVVVVRAERPQLLPVVALRVVVGAVDVVYAVSQR